MAIDLLSAHHSIRCSSCSLSFSSSSTFEQEDEDYIDLEVSSRSFFHSPTCSSLNISTREFEFHMSSVFVDAECTTTSPADELFYKGKLLPLHLPPRLQMVEKLLQDSNSKEEEEEDEEEEEEEEEEELYGTPLATPPPTPFVSCHVIGEEYLSDYFTEEAVDFGGESSTKLWRKKLKELIRQSLFNIKLKTGKSYMSSLFGKSICSYDSCATTIYEESTIKAKDRIPKRGHKQVGNIFRKESVKETDLRTQHRRSVCIGSKRHVLQKKSSSSSECMRFREIQLGKRNNDIVDSPIEGAIKHCKQSQYLVTNCS